MGRCVAQAHSAGPCSAVHPLAPCDSKGAAGLTVHSGLACNAPYPQGVEAPTVKGEGGGGHVRLPTHTSEAVG